MIEIDINTGIVIEPKFTIFNSNWVEIWEKLGLQKLRNGLSNWVINIPNNPPPRDFKDIPPISGQKPKIVKP
jgi:hypothetical protein